MRKRVGETPSDERAVAIPALSFFDERETDEAEEPEDLEAGDEGEGADEDEGEEQDEQEELDEELAELLDDFGIDEVEDFNPKRALLTIKKLRDNERANRKQLKRLSELEEKLEEQEREEMDELERAQSDLQDAQEAVETLRSKLQSERLSNAVKLAAIEAGAYDPADILPQVEGDIEIDEDGKVKYVEDAVAALKEEKPYLFDDGSDKRREKPDLESDEGNDEVDDEERVTSVKRRYGL